MVLCCAAGMFMAADAIEQTGALVATSFMTLSQNDALLGEIRNVLCNIFPKLQNAIGHAAPPRQFS